MGIYYKQHHNETIKKRNNKIKKFIFYTTFNII